MANCPVGMPPSEKIELAIHVWGSCLQGGVVLCILKIWFAEKVFLLQGYEICCGGKALFVGETGLKECIIRKFIACDV